MFTFKSLALVSIPAPSCKAPPCMRALSESVTQAAKLLIEPAFALSLVFGKSTHRARSHFFAVPKWCSISGSVGVHLWWTERDLNPELSLLAKREPSLREKGGVFSLALSILLSPPLWLFFCCLLLVVWAFGSQPIETKLNQKKEGWKLTWRSFTLPVDSPRLFLRERQT